MQKIGISRIGGIIQVIIDYLIKILGLIIICLIMNKIGKCLFKDIFNSSYLLSFSLIPLVNIIKPFSRALIYPITVKVFLTENAITTKSGLYRIFEDTLEVKNIENIEYYYSLIGKIFNFKTIVIRNYGSKIQLPYVINPEKVVLEIKEMQKNNLNK